LILLRNNEIQYDTSNAIYKMKETFSCTATYNLQKFWELMGN